MNLSQDQRQSLEELILLAIHEDIHDGDVTSRAIFAEAHRSTGTVRAKEAGIFCGGDIAKLVYYLIDRECHVTIHVDEGTLVEEGTIVITVEGPTTSVLSGERIMLNFLQRMCGIATATSRVVSRLEGTDIKVLDTRKTLPGFRFLDKYSVKAGGGTNHRMGLFDMVMIKDNHIKAAGSISNAVRMIRDSYEDTYQVEVETTNLDEVREAIQAGADIIMLDNMTTEMMRHATELIPDSIKIEVSGNITEEKLKALKDLAVSYISMGGLTHSVTAFDLSMKFS